MTFLYLSAEGGKYVREHFNPEVYHYDCKYLFTVNHLDEIEQLYPELFI